MTAPQPIRHDHPSADPTRSGDTDARRWWAGSAHPVWTAVALVVAVDLIAVSIGVAGERLAPGGGDTGALIRRLVAVLLVAAAAVAVVGRAKAWRATAAAGPASWRDTRLLLVPALVAIAPLATGLNMPATSTVAVLVIGYAATGVFEELWHRGVVLDALRPVGLRRAALIGGALFGVSHLTNVAFGQPLAISLAQSVGAFCFGVGFSILRWRTNAVWLLAAVHAVGDLMFHITNLHGGALWGVLVGHDIAMLLWGLWCLRGLQRDDPHDGHTSAQSLHSKQNLQSAGGAA